MSGATLTEGGDNVISIRQRGELCGELSFFFGIRQNTNARTSSTSTASFFCLPKEDYLQLLKLYPQEEENLTRNALAAFDDFSGGKDGQSSYASSTYSSEQGLKAGSSAAGPVARRLVARSPSRADGACAFRLVSGSSFTSLRTPSRVARSATAAAPLPAAAPPPCAPSSCRLSALPSPRAPVHLSTPPRSACSLSGDFSPAGSGTGGDTFDCTVGVLRRTLQEVLARAPTEPRPPFVIFWRDSPHRCFQPRC